AIRSRTDADFIATAHTRKDQAETVLMRFLTGSGTTRLQGISPAKSGRILRPFLDVDREEVLELLSERKVVPREDRSNEDERFLRNRIRLDIMPRLLEINPNLISTLCETASQARSESAALEELVRRSSSGWVLESADRTTFDLGQAPDDPWLRQAVLARQIRRLEPGMRDVSAHDLKRLVDEWPRLRRVSVSGSLELAGDGKKVTLRLRQTPARAFELEVVPGTSVLIPEIGKRLTLERRQNAPGEPSDAFQLPSADTSAPFIVRSRRPGDRFHPAGRSSDRSLSDFLIERRIPREVRDSIPLLTWRGEIVSVGGVGIAEPFRVRDASQEVYVIVLEETV
ncbi:MAG TPA: tRNA lysidine(34) synthetase TilS, partial [Thermoanaerobaculia bacterium]|nr:tRNA lysidine(34) synthetase TilS [Thermoanaerobaculia bacterium]